MPESDSRLTATRQPSRWMRVYAGGNAAGGIANDYDDFGLTWMLMETLHGSKRMPCEWTVG